jgi:hypothetical protein
MQPGMQRSGMGNMLADSTVPAGRLSLHPCQRIRESCVSSTESKASKSLVHRPTQSPLRGCTFHARDTRHSAALRAGLGTIAAPRLVRIAQAVWHNPERYFSFEIRLQLSLDNSLNSSPFVIPNGVPRSCFSRGFCARGAQGGICFRRIRDESRFLGHRQPSE